MTVTESAVTSDEQRVIDLVDDLLASFPPKETDPKVFLGEQFDRGLAWVHFPEGHGGLDLSPKLQKTINERVFARRRAEPLLPQPDRLRHVRADGRGVGQRGAEDAVPAPAVHGRGDLVPAVLRAGRRFRLRRPVGPRRARRRRVDRQRPEGVDDAGPHLTLGPARGAHRPRRPEARRPHRVRRRHARAGRRGPPAAPDDRRGRVQRGLLHRRPHPRHASASATPATAGGCRSPRS